MINKLFSFEDKFDVICKAISKKRNKWHLNAITWMDFDDVTQIIKLHIYKKWSMWDQTKPLEPWIGRIISNQLKNLIRNNYSNYARPCLSCPHNMAEDQCSLTPNGLQSNICLLYAKWEKTKKAGYDLKMPVTIENHRQEIESTIDCNMFSFVSVGILNNEMQKTLTCKQYTAYMMLFFEDKNEEDVAKFMGYKTNEKNRMIGYKQIKNLKKLFREKATEILTNKDVCYGDE